MRILTSAVLFAATFLEALPAAAHEAAPGAGPKIRLVSGENHQKLLKFLPQSNDKWLATLKDQDIIFYTDAEMPAAYQHDGGVHSPLYNISAAQPREPFGNANREFPWKGTAGLDDSPNGISVQFVLFPPGGQILYWQELLPHERRYAYVWEYPVGTVFGEMLLVRDQNGYGAPFEIRTRTKTADKKTPWRVNLYRPFASPAELIARIKKLDPGWKTNEAFQAYLKNGEVAVETLVNRHPVKVIDRVALADELPLLDEALVWELLKTPFKSVLGQEWVKSGSTMGFAPTTKADFHIVPKNYQGHHLAVSSRACMTCHDTVNKHVNEFEFNRDWYGRVRGSDGIFSFHIFEPSSISYNGFSYAPRIREEFVRAGLLQAWSP
jgi:hypothetical protein